MRPLLIDDSVKEAAAKVVQFAEQHVLSVDDLLDTVNGELPSVGDQEGYTCHIPVGYRAVFSIENQGTFHVRHLSVSVDRAGKLPHPDAVQEIMGLFGFTNKLRNCMVKVEYLEDAGQAINVWEKIGFNVTRD
jgi:hypothetical protein